jgi:hypothetical protein
MKATASYSLKLGVNKQHVVIAILCLRDRLILLETNLNTIFEISSVTPAFDDQEERAHRMTG